MTQEVRGRITINIILYFLASMLVVPRVLFVNAQTQVGPDEFRYGVALDNSETYKFYWNDENSEGVVSMALECEDCEGYMVGFFFPTFLDILYVIER